MKPNSKLRELAGILRAKYGAELQQILFFGSQARGDASIESDYDCLLIFEKVTPSLRKSLDQLSAEWLLKRGIVFSWVALNKEDLERLRYEPFLQNVRKEGIAA